MPHASSPQCTQGRTRRCVDGAPRGQREACSNNLSWVSALSRLPLLGTTPSQPPPLRFTPWERSKSPPAERSLRSGVGGESERSEQGWGPNHQRHPERNDYHERLLTNNQAPHAPSSQRTQGRTQRCVDGAPRGQRERCSNNLSRNIAPSRLPLSGTTHPRPLPTGGAHTFAACWEPPTPGPSPRRGYFSSVSRSAASSMYSWLVS